MGARLSEHRTVLAERLLQAAACGRLALVQRCAETRVLWVSE